VVDPGALIVITPEYVPVVNCVALIDTVKELGVVPDGVTINQLAFEDAVQFKAPPPWL
jgi:hypothetical protein